MGWGRVLKVFKARPSLDFQTQISQCQVKLYLSKPNTTEMSTYTKLSIKRGCSKFVENIHEWVKYPCSECDYEATQKNHLNEHIKFIYEGVKYSCSECEFKATAKSNLNTHIKSIHEEVKYPCSEWDYEAILSLMSSWSMKGSSTRVR